MSKNWLGGLAIVLVIGLGVYVFSRPAPTPPAGASGADHYSFEQFFAGMTTGQGVIASSSLFSVTLSGSEFLNADTLAYTELNAGVTLTLPASTTPLCNALRPDYQRRTVLIRNMSSSTLTIAGSTSIVLKVASTSATSAGVATVLGTADGTGIGRLDIVKIPKTTTGVGCVANLTTFN